MVLCKTLDNDLTSVKVSTKSICGLREYRLKTLTKRSTYPDIKFLNPYLDLKVTEDVGVALYKTNHLSNISKGIN